MLCGFRTARPEEQDLALLSLLPHISMSSCFVAKLRTAIAAPFWLRFCSGVVGGRSFRPERRTTLDPPPTASRRTGALQERMKSISLYCWTRDAGMHVLCGFICFGSVSSWQSSKPDLESSVQLVNCGLVKMGTTSPRLGAGIQKKQENSKKRRQRQRQRIIVIKRRREPHKHR